jgi:hypothetical protein
MRLLAFSLLLAISGIAAAASYRTIQKAADDDQMLINAGVEPERAQIRKPCAAAIVDVDERPNFFDCVYVQTGHAMNLFTLEGGYLMSELQLTLGNMDGVALQRMGKYSQLQVFSGRRVAALYIQSESWIDNTQTEAAYQWLIDHGVQRRQPHRWIGP